MCHSSAQAFLLSSEIRCLIQTLIEKYLKKKKKKQPKNKKKQKKQHNKSECSSASSRGKLPKRGGEKFSDGFIWSPAHQ